MKLWGAIVELTGINCEFCTFSSCESADKNVTTFFNVFLHVIKPLNHCSSARIWCKAMAFAYKVACTFLGITLPNRFYKNDQKTYLRRKKACGRGLCPHYKFKIEKATIGVHLQGHNNKLPKLFVHDPTECSGSEFVETRCLESWNSFPEFSHAVSPKLVQSVDLLNFAFLSRMNEQAWLQRKISFGVLTKNTSTKCPIRALNLATFRLPACALSTELSRRLSIHWILSNCWGPASFMGL